MQAQTDMRLQFYRPDMIDAGRNADFAAATGAGLIDLCLQHVGNVGVDGEHDGSVVLVLSTSKRLMR